MEFFVNQLTSNSLIFVATSVVLLYFFVQQKFQYWKRRGIKSLPVTSIFGNFSDCIFARKPLRDFFRESCLFGKGEKMVGFYVLDKPFLILRDPECIKDVLVRDFKNFSNRCWSPNKGDFIGEVNIFSVKNPAWKILRQKLSPTFTSSKLKNMFSLILETSDNLEKYLDNIATSDNNNVVDVKEVCEKFTTDVIGLTMFGMKLNALDNPNAEFREEGKKHFENTYKRYFSLMSLLFMPRIAKLLGVTFFDPDVPTFFKRVIREAMMERIKSKCKRNDLFDAFIEMRENYMDKNDEFHHYFQDDGLIATGIVFFLGGFEPSASMMYLTLYELSKHPDIQSRLRQEILDALNETGGKITYELVMSLQYLDMVSSEGLRKYPLLHFLDREAENNYTFTNTNITIDKGTPIIIPMSGIHMDPEYFPDPDIFDPERFSPENRKKIIPYTYFPFGEGPRNCIGMRIGLVQAKVGLIQILSKYEVTTCKETPNPLTFDSYTIFTKSKQNILLDFRKLKS
ncbi:hypothetical protein QAD02_019522 [Eretmocerus hayati]|uniref:Uncharacterized protein n=1 Tax=Eretmocerus hayati TaxID=131215 RepID=A0ACC2PPL3_9HYME|nr:hypothetical protein QAD02_019522 [Eretmocerus hayati]